MVNYCICAGCTNSSLSGHRVHHFPSRKNKAFRSWVRFVQVKRADFTAASVTTHSVVCGAHFTPENYRPGDLMESRMGFRSKDHVRLITDAVPTVHSKESSPRSKFTPDFGAGGTGGPSANGSKHSVQRKRALSRILAESAASNEGIDAPSTVDFEDTEGFSLHNTEPVLHRGSQCNIKCLQCSSGEEEASRRNYSRRNYGHTIVKMEIKEEPCRIKDEDTEEQIDPMEENEDKQHHFTNEDGELKYKNEDKQHLFQESHHFKNEDGNAVVSKTEENFTQKQAGKSGVEGSLTCSECGKCFIRKSDLNKHMKIHTEKNLFSCTQCGKSFTQKGSLRYHLHTHSGVRSFSCDQCEKTFVLASSLKTHLKTHTALKPHFCSLCGKSFTLLKYLKVHESTHTGVRPYMCSDCGHSFITNTLLKRHQRIHSGEKPFKCSHCGKSFARSGVMKAHERVHTGEKPYQCSSCEKRFTQLSHLRTHKKNHCPKL